MQIMSVKGEARAPGNRHAGTRLRNAGLVPAVIYGHGETPETVALSRHDLEIALQASAHVIKVQSGDGANTYLLKEVQYDHLQQKPLHVDLMRVDENERVPVHVSIEYRGDPKGAHEGGVVLHVMTDLHVECPLLKIPESVRVNVSHLGLGDAIHVKDVELPDGVKPLHEPDDVVCVCRLPRVHEATPTAAPVEAEASIEPEVIGRIAKEKPEEGAKE
ncbi:MAG: 50S ribosomal protein L25 [Phycisphaerae bacterium]